MMDRRVAGLLALLIVTPGAFITHSDFRAGISRFWLSGPVFPLRAERAVNPAYFWVFTVINWMVIVAILAVSVVMVALP